MSYRPDEHGPDPEPMPRTVVTFHGTEYEAEATSLTSCPNGDGGLGYYSRRWMEHVIDHHLLITNIDTDEIVADPADELFEMALTALETEFNVVRA